MKAIIVLLITLIGCSTPYELKRTKPRISYTTTRSAHDVKNCIRDKWKEHISPVYEDNNDDGWVIRFDDVFPAATVAIVTIEGKDQPEAKVQYFHRTDRIKLHRLEEEVLDCK